MAKKRRTTDHPIGKRLEQLVNDPYAIEVKFSEHRASTLPMYSKKYCDANGVVLFYNDAAVLSNYDSQTPSKEYLLQMISELAEGLEARNVTAVIVGGDREHFQENKDILSEHGIAVVGKYLDKWDEDKGPQDIVPGERNIKAVKEVVVIPETQEVLLYSDAVGYLNLSP
ncbi:MAG: hypothetical protein GY861_12295 [bacterium]|nr:hypothetical protein [bacterium]